MSQGQLRRQYPDSVSSFRYHFESLGSFAKIELGDSEFYLTVTPTGTGEGWCGTASGQAHRFGYAWVGDELHLWLDGHLFIYQRDVERRRNRGKSQGGAADVLAPMPGTVLEVLVKARDRVEKDQTVIIMESMKMELVITVSGSGVVRRVTVETGDQVDKGMRLLELAEEPGSLEQ